jgi:hypothetical protein
VGFVVFISTSADTCTIACSMDLHPGQTKKDCQAPKHCQAMPRRSCTLEEACQSLTGVLLSAQEAWER